MSTPVAGTAVPLRGAEGRHTAELRLREEIVRGTVVPGQRLVEPELCERYGVTRNSARLALDALIAEGLVERIPNRGARVRVTTPAEVVAVLECRQVLDGLLARRAAQHAADDDVDRLRTNLERLRRAVRRREVLRCWAAVREHRRLLAAGAGQPLASALLERLERRTAHVEFQLLLTAGRPERALDDVERSVVAVADRAADRAQAAARGYAQGLLDELRAAAADAPRLLAHPDAAPVA